MKKTFLILALLICASQSRANSLYAVLPQDVSNCTVVGRFDEALQLAEEFKCGKNVYQIFQCFRGTKAVNFLAAGQWNTGIDYGEYRCERPSIGYSKAIEEGTAP